MIKLTNLIVENNLREYSEEEKKKMGIPSGATSRGGVWYVGDKYAGKVVNGKFVAAGKEQPANPTAKPKAAPAAAGGKGPPSDTTKTKTSAPASDSGNRFGPDTGYLQVRQGATPKERQLVGKVNDMWGKVANQEFMAKHVGQSYPTAEFEKMTGIPAAAAKLFSSTVDDYETPFVHDPHDDTVYITDPMDI
jgi:hypothetical protein